MTITTVAGIVALTILCATLAQIWSRHCKRKKLQELLVQIEEVENEIDGLDAADFATVKLLRDVLAGLREQANGLQ